MSKIRGLRLMIYDDTCRSGAAKLGKLQVGLTHSWVIGARLYQARNQLDAAMGVRSWEEAFRWILDVSDGSDIEEIQFWGHGKWGSAFIEREVFNEDSLLVSHALAPLLDRLALQLQEHSLFWFRTCETFGAHAGHAFAQHFSQRLGCVTAGHTFIIGPWQSGLHSLRPGEMPQWSVDEGLEEGTAEAPLKAKWSGPFAPHTLNCLQSRIPTGW